VLHDLLGLAPERLAYIVNHPTPYGKLAAADLGAMVDSDQVVEVPFGGEEVSRSALEGFPLVMGRSTNAASKAIIALARRIERTGREALALAGQV